MQKTWIQLLLAASLLSPFALANADNQTATAPQGVYTETTPEIHVTRAQPKFVIQLASNPTTGYSWELQPYNQNMIVLVDHHFVAPQTGLIGAPGVEQWTFIAKNAAFKDKRDADIQFQYGRAWEQTKAKVVSFKVKF